jgi:TonB family protein
MKNTLLALAISLAPLFLNAQADTSIRYLDYDLNETSPDKASDTVLTIRQKLDDGSMLAQDFFVSTGKIMRRSYFTGTEFNVPAGPSERYHRNGRLREKGNFANGKKSGIWRSWSAEGTLLDSIRYNEKGNMTGTRIRWYDNGAVEDSTVYNEDGSGNGYRYGWFSNRALRCKGAMINDREDGPWTFYHRSGNISTEELYQNGKLISIRCIDENGTVRDKDCVAEFEAEFPGGIEAWQKFVVKSIQSNMRALERENANGTSVVQFIIDTDGKVMEAKVVQSGGAALDQAAVRIIMKSPNWIPARLHNVPVKAYRRQPISFYLR